MVIRHEVYIPTLKRSNKRRGIKLTPKTTPKLWNNREIQKFHEAHEEHCGRRQVLIRIG